MDTRDAFRELIGNAFVALDGPWSLDGPWRLTIETEE